MFGLGAIVAGLGGGKGKFILLAGIVVLAGFAWNTANNPLQNSSSQKTGGFFGDALRQNREGTAVGEKGLRNGNQWGDTAIRIGMSFGAAMIFGSLLRVAFKTALTLGVVAGVVFWLLQSQGIIDPISEDYYGSVREGRNWMVTQFGVVGTFLQERLPSASAALIGFGFGLRK